MSESDALAEPWALPLLRELASGEFVSGEQMARNGGVSRVAIWKRLERLQAAGVPIESQHRNGYRIPGGLDLLSRDRLADLLAPSTSALLRGIHMQLSTGSTNADAIELMGLNPAHGGELFLAEQQLGGRGRRGRQWVSPFASNVYMTVGWKFHCGAAMLEGLSLVVGLAVVEALTALGAAELKIKWPNDIWSKQGKKLGGILIEMHGSIEGPLSVAIGIGLNISMNSSAAAAIDQPWTDLHGEVGERVERNRVVAAVLEQLLPALDGFVGNGFAAHAERWRGYDFLDGKTVSVHLPLKSESGIARGVDSHGNLMLEIDGELKSFSAGDVSVRPQ